MAKRYYVSKVEVFEGGDGREVGVAARHYGIVTAQNIQLDALGNPVSDWALCILESDNHTQAAQDPGCIALPQFALDSKVSSMHAATKAAMVNQLKAFGIITDFIGNADGFRDVIRTLGVQHNPAFDENVGSWQL